MTRRSFCSDLATAFDTSVMNSVADAGLKVLLVPDQNQLVLIEVVEVADHVHDVSVSRYPGAIDVRVGES